MKRRALIAHLTAHGCYLQREGRRHSIYVNPATRVAVGVPRHREVHEILARKICRDLGVPEP